MSEIKDRICLYIKQKKMSQAEFQRKAKLGSGFIGKIGERITEASISLIEDAFPDLNIEWLKTGEGEMIIDPLIAAAAKEANEQNMLEMVHMMQRFIDLGEKNSEANLINAEANKLNASNLERLITIIENKLVEQ